MLVHSDSGSDSGSDNDGCIDVNDRKLFLPRKSFDGVREVKAHASDEPNSISGRTCDEYNDEDEANPVVEV